MAALQPNFQQMHQNFLHIAEQFLLFQNLPGLQAIHQLMLQLQQQFVGMNERLDRIEAKVERIPWQLYNASASLDAPLQYPPGVNPDPDGPLPMLKRDLLDITAANCMASLHLLNAPLPPAHALVAQRRQKLMDFLGSGMRAA
ncbi:hypothetical protein BGW80DRAFT_1559732 [Lactifluus volemus]|nr:hypothetical protein BGW80DRAFT_1559732 [Lactifluus volemus]